MAGFFRSFKSKRIKFDNAGFYFLGLPIIAFAGFGVPYFTQLLPGGKAFSFYTHFHAFVVVVWIAILISQPFLIRSGKRAWHRTIGRLSYMVMPMLLLSVVWIIHDRLTNSIDSAATIELDVSLGLPVFAAAKDMLVLTVVYCMAIIYRKTPALHARFMVCTVIPFIEPALSRALIYLPPFLSPLYAGLATFIIYDLIIVALLRNDRANLKGRLIFGGLLGAYLLIQTAGIQIGRTQVWTDFCLWFASLPLTA